jgi:hypothetical protein
VRLDLDQSQEGLRMTFFLRDLRQPDSTFPSLIAGRFRARALNEATSEDQVLLR